MSELLNQSSSFCISGFVHYGIDDSICQCQLSKVKRPSKSAHWYVPSASQPSIEPQHRARWLDIAGTILMRSWRILSLTTRCDTVPLPPPPVPPVRRLQLQRIRKEKDKRRLQRACGRVGGEAGAGIDAKGAERVTDYEGMLEGACAESSEPRATGGR